MIISRILATISLIGMLGLVGYEYLQYVQEQARVISFMNAGSRFTGQQGQELCERVRALEERSYGFRDAGKTPLDCRYEKR